MIITVQNISSSISSETDTVYLMLAAIEAKIGIQVMFIESIPFILAKMILQVFLLNCIRCLKSLCPWTLGLFMQCNWKLKQYNELGYYQEPR
jgi:hypothetical protein